jgi:hypothetical protein
VDIKVHSNIEDPKRVKYDVGSSFKRDFQSKYITMKQWSMADDCYRRYVWVEILGLPSHVWCRQNFGQVVSNIGKF